MFLSVFSSHFQTHFQFFLLIFIVLDLSLEDPSSVLKEDAHEEGGGEDGDEEEEEDVGFDYDKSAVTEAVASMTKAVLEIHEDAVEEVRPIHGKVIRYSISTARSSGTAYPRQSHQVQHIHGKVIRYSISTARSSGTAYPRRGHQVQHIPCGQGQKVVMMDVTGCQSQR